MLITPSTCILKNFAFKKRMKTTQRLKVIPIILEVWPQGISNPHYTNLSLRNQTPNTNRVYDLKLHATELILLLLQVG